MPYTYDACVIGTSPISLLAALKLAASDKKIIIVEKNKNYGGAWSITNLSNFDGLEIETACHLIEHYSGVYQKISKLSGVPFKYCHPQPVKIKDGKISSYFTAITILKEILTPISILLILPFIRVINLISPVKINKGRYLNYKNLLNNVLFKIKHRVPSILSFKGIMEPHFGYARFVKVLLDKVRSSNIEIIDAEFIDYCSCRSGLVDVLLSRGTISTRKLYLTESIEVGKGSSIFNNINANKTFKKNKYWHIVIEVNGFIGDNVPSYIHFPDDKILHRMTKDGQVNARFNKNLFLLQTRADPFALNEKEIKSRVIEILALFNVSAVEKNIIFHDVFERLFYSFRRVPPLYNFKSKNNVVFISSIGDLARNIATNTLFD